MEEYIQEALQQGCIVPMTSPAYEKKGGDLCLGIGFRGLNKISVKCTYPLPLVPAALEQLLEASFHQT